MIKEEQLHPVRGSLQHIDLQQVRLDEKIQAEVALELEGAETAPGVKGGGVLEHVTREITVEALPTDIPDRIVLDVSAMEINDTLQLSVVTAPDGVTFVAEDPEEITIVTLSPPRVEEVSSPRSRRRPSWSARARRGRGRPEGEAAIRATPRASSPCRCSAAGERGEQGDRILIVGLGNPGPEYAHPPQRRLRGGARAGAALGPAAGRSTSSAGVISEGRTGPGGRGWRCCSRSPS